VQEGYDKARAIIEEKADALERIALALLEREVLDGAEVLQLINGETLRAIETPRTIPPDDGPPQQILKPDPSRRIPGILPEGGPQPA